MDDDIDAILSCMSWYQDGVSLYAGEFCGKTASPIPIAARAALIESGRTDTSTLLACSLVDGIVSLLDHRNSISHSQSCSVVHV